MRARFSQVRSRITKVSQVTYVTVFSLFLVFYSRLAFECSLTNTKLHRCTQELRCLEFPNGIFNSVGVY